MIAEIGESQEFYVVLVTVFLLLGMMWALQKWWTTYR